ncbi:MAG TPA: hypothetical protein VLK79_16560 [Gaiellales bacterium]|nr:hypothetical protein [Gaiellales bacterium]
MSAGQPPKKPQHRRALPKRPAEPAGKRRSVWLEHELYAELVRRAQADDRSISYVIRQFIKRGLREKPTRS